MLAPSPASNDLRRSALRVLTARAQQLRLQRPRARYRGELERLRGALRRLELGTWGACARCGCAIGRNRLAALPEVQTCVLCAAVDATTGEDL